MPINLVTSNKRKIELLALAVSALLLFSQTLYAQSTLSSKKKKAVERYKEANKYRVRGQYTKAVPLLQEAIKKDSKFIEAYFLLGILHKRMRNFIRSNEMFQTGLEVAYKTPKKQQDFLFELGDNYLREGKYKQSLHYLNQYLETQVRVTPKTKLANRWLINNKYSLKNKKEWPLNKPRFMEQIINRFKLQYFPVLTADEEELIYTRRVSPAPHADEDLVISKKNSNGDWLPPVSISENINSTANEGTCSISADGRLLIFTSCAGRKGYGSCDLFFSTKKGDIWSKPGNMGNKINTRAWESQPSLSADGRTLYFTSEREGGLGGKDIYTSHLQKNGQWSEAKNIGSSINTPYDEISPFLHTSGQVLFFASNGKPGFGGYDIYKSNRKETGWEPAVNFGSLINDYEDQFSLFITANGKKGYYSYEKGAYQNMSKLVEITIPEELQIQYKSNIVKGIVKDKKTNLVLPARIELFDLKEGELISVVDSDSVNGQYLVALTQGSDYALYTYSTGYMFNSLNFNYENNTNDSKIIFKNIYLEQERVGGLATLSNIFFNLNQYKLNDKSRIELNKMITYMVQNPGVKIEIGGHTDNIGENAYNRQLSLKRAQAVASYLVGKGINKSRLVQKGYGADRPIFPNDTEENRQKNRRIEFKITQL